MTCKDRNLSTQPPSPSHLLRFELFFVFTPMAEQHTYKFDVKMTCGGCSGAVTRVLDKAKTSGGVSEFKVDLQTQEVIVKGTNTYDEVLETIKKTGKEVRSGVVVE